MLTSAFATAVAAAACGGGSHKQAEPPSADAGAAGDTSVPPDANGGAAGAKVKPEPSAGEAGMEVVGSAGAAGAPDSAGTAGEAGSPPIETSPVQVLFTVGSGAKGLAGSALANSAHPTSIIFGADSPDAAAVNGANRVVISAAQLGIDDGDTIDAFTALRPSIETLSYLFSVRNASGQQGLPPTRLNRSSLEDGAPGDVYYSDATESYRWLGEGGDHIGYNGLIADEQSLGLSSTPDQLGDRDDLTGVLPLLDGKLPTVIYFSVSRDSAGLENTAVGTSEAGDRGCTIYKSTLNGTNSVAYSCTELGLAANAEVKGLSLIASATGAATVLFTVDSSSAGVAQSGVDDQTYKANNVYSSTGNGTNSLQVRGQELGLDDYDEIDALAVLDQTTPDYSKGTDCNLVPGPLDVAGAGLLAFGSAHGLGKTLILVAGQAVGPNLIGGVGAYNVKTCAFVTRADLTTSTALQGAWAPVPLTGWSAADPLKKLEYWSLSSAGNELGLSRIDATGAIVNSYAFANLPDATDFSGFHLDYDAANDRLIGVLNPKNGSQAAYRLIVIQRPAANVPDDTLLDAVVTPLPHPCAYSPDLTGVDDDGNAYIAQWDFDSYSSTYRVCPIAPNGEFSDAPFSATVGSNRTQWGLIVPGDSLYGLYQDNEFQLVRRALIP